MGGKKVLGGGTKNSPGGGKDAFVGVSRGKTIKEVWDGAT